LQTPLLTVCDGFCYSLWIICLETLSADPPLCGLSAQQPM